MKKLISILLTISMLLCFAACSAEKTPEDEASSVDSSSLESLISSVESVVDTVSEPDVSSVVEQPKPVETPPSVVSTPQEEIVSSEAVVSTPEKVGYDVRPEDEVEWHRGYINNYQEYFEKMKYSESNERDSFIHYLLHAPSCETNEAKPLFIFLHGLNGWVSIQDPGDAKNMVDGLIELENQDEKFAAYTLVPITPDGTQGWWTDFQKRNFKNLLRKLIANYNIDPKRVYISGFSMGGMVTCQLVNEMPENTFAAVVPLAGISDMNYPAGLYKTAFRIYHATGDGSVSVSSSRRLYQQLKSSGHPNVELIEYEGGNHKTPLYEAFIAEKDEFFEWIFAQKLP